MSTGIVTTQKQLDALRQYMKNAQIDAYFVPAEDEHLNEYLPDHHKRTQWLTGFTGENAPALVTAETIYLYADGRFHIQVDYETNPEIVTAVKLGTPNAATLESTLKQLLEQKSPPHPSPPPKGEGVNLVVGYDPFTVTPKALERIQSRLKSTQIKWKPVEGNLIDQAWAQFIPPHPSKPLFILDDRTAGQSVQEKLKAVRQKMTDNNVELLPVTRLDEIAWLLNIRGYDIPYNLVVESYVLLTQNDCGFYVRAEAVTLEAKDILEANNIDIYDYQTILDDLEDAHKNGINTFWYDTDGVTIGLINKLGDKLSYHKARSPIMDLKALKNQTEIAGMANANKLASMAIIEHMAWAHASFSQNERLNEVNLRADIEKRYAEKSGYFDLSFPTIPGLNDHSAIIHYCEADENEVAKDSGWYLLDSGAHYFSDNKAGTTDTTRTTVFGTPTAEQKEKYTAVLKAHIDCAMQVFPKGTTGAQLDAICRAPLWNLNLNFGHGTGHGVGAFLNVHEGPNRISSVCDIKFEPGMITSNEPGYYQANWGGIRLENLYVVEDLKQTISDGQPAYGFRSLTLAPFEKKLIAFDMLTAQELAWLKAFYKRIETEVLPLIAPHSKDWLTEQLAV